MAMRTRRAVYFPITSTKRTTARRRHGSGRSRGRRWTGAGSLPGSVAGRRPSRSSGPAASWVPLYA
eukprot:7191145-Lingulodinium_polyedra.AAC.1